jgi:GT2 family glycosyltransferase
MNTIATCLDESTHKGQPIRRGPSASILLPSWERPADLTRCLLSLACQTTLPLEAVIVWQADDTQTRDLANSLRNRLPFEVKTIHCQERGVVPAENAALSVARGDVIALIDDDVVVPATWLERVLAHYSDPAVGAVGGPIVNHRPDGKPFPKRRPRMIAKLSWYGKFRGNTYDLAEDLLGAVTEVEHLAGNNMSLRRCAFDRFEPALRAYWQSFEADACLQVRQNGFRILFDSGNLADHYPTNTAYVGDRSGDLTVKVLNPAYNHALILAKFMPWYYRPWQLLYLLAVGTVGCPGLLATLVAIRRFGNVPLELDLLWQTWRSRLAGWRQGRSLAAVYQSDRLRKTHA